MPPDAYRQIIVASIAGGCVGVLVMWNRSRSQNDRENKLRRVIVFILGTAASAFALFAFSNAFGGYPNLYAAIVMILITGWAAVSLSVVQLPIPRPLLRVGISEFSVLRARWTGVRLFGALLRNTPLRRLGGRVYLVDVGHDPLVVLRGIRDAEVVHIWALMFCCPWLVFWGTQGWWTMILSSLAVQLPLNVYPILHLRFITRRIEDYVGRIQRNIIANRAGA